MTDVIKDIATDVGPGSPIDWAALRDVWLTRLAPLLACIGLLLAWQAGALLLHTDSVPSALDAIRAVPDILGDRESLFNILDSIRRMAMGLAAAVVLAIPLGLMMGRVRAIASFFNPLLMVIYPVPKAALMPIIMLWLGVGDLSKTLVIFLAVTLPIVYHSFQGAKAVEEKMIWSGAAMGLSPLQNMLRVVLPAALPEILAGCRTGLVLALITMVTSEMIARKSGAGNILFNALDMGQYDTVFAMIMIIGALGIILDAAFDRLRRALVAWSDPRQDIPLSFS
jgi:NitT/TauT family transport system permease protein